MLHEFDKKSNKALSNLRSQLLTFKGMFAIFKSETEQDHNITRSADARLTASLEKSIYQNLTETSRQLNAIAEATAWVTNNQSTNQQHIVSLVGQNCFCSCLTWLSQTCLPEKRFVLLIDEEFSSYGLWSSSPVLVGHRAYMVCSDRYQKPGNYDHEHISVICYLGIWYF